MATQQPNWRQCLAFFDSDLFKHVQGLGLFPDSKTFADVIVKSSWAEAIEAYEQEKLKPNFAIADFLDAHFTLPDLVPSASGKTFNTVAEHIENMWDILTRTPDTTHNDSLIALSRPYIVPGGRFREIYYWDSYFTALGLMDAGRGDMAVNMLENFLDILDEVGCIPNGNRAYYYSRSQPPILALLFTLTETKLTDAQRTRAIKGMHKEYEFWMRGSEQVGHATPACERVVSMPDGSVLNRYFDSETSPRPESYREDIETAEQIGANNGEFYRNIRAACESGWDFSSRWLSDPQSLASIRTTEIVPVDLNALLYYLESTLAQVSEGDKAEHFDQAAKVRKAAIDSYLFNTLEQGYFDFHFPSKSQTNVVSAAMTVPLFVGMASAEQAAGVKQCVMDTLLKDGGIVTTANNTHQQWDQPNGWAPLQWFAVHGFREYGYADDANTIMQRFTHIIEAHYNEQGVILEKYNVCEPTLTAKGGEYEVQLGFGWTNGVYTRFKTLLSAQR